MPESFGIASALKSHVSSDTNSLHGSAPENASTVLLLIDVINDFEYEKGATLFERALPAARKLKALKVQLGKRGVPTIYANDNFGKWRSDFRASIKNCLRKGSRGAPVARLLYPKKHDYFVLKPKHSAFFSTTLATLLEYLGTKRIIMGGWQTHSCVLSTASDAFVRDYKVIIAEDGTAAMEDEDQTYALHHCKSVLKAKVLSCEKILQLKL